MLDDLRRCYEVLGIAPQASAQELKAAYRDLAKVWHPDRFTHDPRLQQKAQEKLKEINEAYAQLTSGATPRRARAPHAAAAPPQTPASAPPTAPDHLDVRRTQRQPILLAALVFIIALCAGTTALWVRHKANTPPPADTAAPAQTQVGGAEQAPAVAEAGTASTVRPSKKRPGPAPQPLSAPAPPSDPAARARNTEALRPMPTVTLLIDPTTNMIATAACPNKLRMTYASGTEPQQLCTAHHAAPAPPAKGARLKSFARSLAAPAQWLRGKDKAESGSPPAPQN